MHIMKAKLPAIMLLAVTLSLGAAESTNRLRFPVAGFSIAPLEAPPGHVTQQALMMWLPLNEVFTANVNVQIQPYSGTIEEYTALTLKQFKEHSAKLIEQRGVGTSAVVLEYSGELQGQSLHWYARAEKSGGHVYLATATTTEQQWPKQATQLKACVESLRCQNGEAPAGPNAAPPQR
jgi:hypothetical protein